jgi:ABC-2 type transport system permease protein
MLLAVFGEYLLVANGFAALGIALGRLLSSDSVGPAVGGLVGVLALLGGSWFPISGHGFMHELAPDPVLLLARAGQPTRVSAKATGASTAGS